MERLRDVLMGREGNSIMPFFWQHGEDQGTLGAYMERIRECGCGGVCVEARPHPEFGKDRWWEDVGFIVDKAKKDGMEVWILDDSHWVCEWIGEGEVSAVFENLFGLEEV